ncbi:CNNM domain-containing protein [Porticoccus sp.]
MTSLLIYLAIAIGISFLCSVLEAVLLSVTPMFVEQTQSANPVSGKMLSRVREQLDESISAILIVNTFAHTMGAAGVGSQAVKLYGAHWETLIAVLLTLAILYFSEIIPKTLGATYWRRLAIPCAYLIAALTRLVYPLVWLATRLTKLFSHHDHEITREEIIALASLGRKGGTLLNRENEYVSNVLRLRDVKTEEILTPRTVTHMLPQSTSVKEALDQPATREFTRIPVFDQGIDDITGKIFRLDLFEAERAGRGDIPLSELAKPIFSVSEKLPVQQLLDLFIKHRAHLFRVEDEFGQTAGIVTLEDAVETLLGREIVDETDRVADLQELTKIKYRERLRDQKQGDDQ